MADSLSDPRGLTEADLSWDRFNSGILPSSSWLLKFCVRWVVALQRLWLAIIILLGLQMTAAAPSIARYNAPNSNLAKTLKSGQFKDLIKDFVRSYQRQDYTVSVNRDQVDQPHRLTIASAGAIKGTITVNGEEVQTLERGSTVVNLAPYLKSGDMTVLLFGRYDPSAEPVTIRFQGPDTELDHQPTETGYLNYQLNLQIK